eukprot:Pompholyxophrys_sp_v1_NODE_4_length_15125_cov_6.573656.p5 type:complete len:246 gc:universal NODE_4_length_15125_cov_6.573656:14011-14748(+)
MDKEQIINACISGDYFFVYNMEDMYFPEMMMAAFGYGHKHICELLYDRKKYTVDRNAVDLACFNGHVHILEWWKNKHIVWWKKLFNKNMMSFSEHALYSACHQGNMQVLKWLFNNSNLYIPVMHQYTFFPINMIVYACGGGHIEIVIWLYFYFKNDINISRVLMNGLVYAAGNNKIKVVKWGCELYGKNKKELERVFIRAYNRNSHHVIDWMMQNIVDFTDERWIKCMQSILDNKNMNSYIITNM